MHLLRIRSLESTFHHGQVLDEHRQTPQIARRRLLWAAAKVSQPGFHRHRALTGNIEESQVLWHRIDVGIGGGQSLLCISRRSAFSSGTARYLRVKCNAVCVCVCVCVCARARTNEVKQLQRRHAPAAQQVHNLVCAPRPQRPLSFHAGRVRRSLANPAYGAKKFAVKCFLTAANLVLLDKWVVPVPWLPLPLDGTPRWR